MKLIFHKNVLLIFCLIFFLPLYSQKTVNGDVVACIEFGKITNINFKEHQYNLEIICHFTYEHNKKFDFINRLQVLNSKNTNITLIDSTHIVNSINVLFKVNCEMTHLWDIKGYPFDEQKLPVFIYMEGYDASKFNFIEDGDDLHIPKFVKLENGWYIESSEDKLRIEIKKKPLSSVIKEIYNQNHDNYLTTNSYNEYSGIYFIMYINRQNKWALFFKLFSGMYAALLVAILALFINIKYLESRFGLAVSALFAAIGNKYTVEGILPESLGFNLSDKLHTLTFIAIILVIYYSIRLLWLKDRIEKTEMDESILINVLKNYNRKARKLILASYAVFTALFMILAFFHTHKQ